MKGVIYCDGGSNQFGSIYCVLTCLDYNGWAMVRKFEKKFNVIQIEYLALIAALEKCTKETPLIFTDSHRIFREVNREKLWELGSKNKDLWKRAKKLMKKKPYLKVKWVSRDKNLAGIHLEKILNERKNQRNNSH